MARWRLFGRRKRPPLRNPEAFKLTSPDGLPVVSLPAGLGLPLSLYGLRGSYSAIYLTQPNVRTVIDFLADEVASVKLKIYQKVPTGPLLPSGRLEMETHDMAIRLNNPAPGMSRSRFWRETLIDLGINDIAFWQKIRDERGRVVSLLRQPPTALTPDRDPKTQLIRRYRTTLATYIELEDLVIFHGYHPDEHDGHASILETLRRILAEEFAAGKNREHTWKNATRKDGVVERPLEAPEWENDQREAWRSDWEGRMSGEANAGRVALLEDGMQWKESAWSPQEMEYLEARKLTRQECAAAFRVDPRIVYASDEKPDREARTAFYVDRLNPLLIRLAEEIDTQLLPDFEPFESESVYSAFNIDAKLQGSFEEQAKILVMTTGRAIVTPDEARARLNLPPAPNGQGEGLTIPLNVAIGGQASPLSPNETPGDEPALGQTPGPGAMPQAASISVSMTPAELEWLRARIAKANGNGEKPERKSPPWHIEQHGDQYCVIVNETSEEVACHDTREEADAHLRALYANVDEGKEEAAKNIRENAQKYAAVVLRHLKRQERTTRGIAGAVSFRDPTIEDVWMNGERWDREMLDDLLKLTTELGLSIAELDVKAATINAQTRAMVEESIGNLDAVFGDTATDRAAKIGISLAAAARKEKRNGNGT